MKRLYACSIMICLTLMTGITTSHPTDGIKVHVVVTTIDMHKDFDEMFKSYIDRELRSLGDVQLVEDDGDWKIDLIIKDSGRRGYFIVSNAQMT